jgi:hypothetical protein
MTGIVFEPKGDACRISEGLSFDKLSQTGQGAGVRWQVIHNHLQGHKNKETGGRTDSIDYRLARFGETESAHKTPDFRKSQQIGGESIKP